MRVFHPALTIALLLAFVPQAGAATESVFPIAIEPTVDQSLAAQSVGTVFVRESSQEVDRLMSMDIETGAIRLVFDAQANDEELVNVFAAYGKVAILTAGYRGFSDRKTDVTMLRVANADGSHPQLIRRADTHTRYVEDYTVCSGNEIVTATFASPDRIRVAEHRLGNSSKPTRCPDPHFGKKKLQGHTLVKTFSTKTGRMLDQVKTDARATNHFDESSLAFSNDARYLFSAERRTLNIVDVTSGRSRRREPHGIQSIENVYPGPGGSVWIQDTLKERRGGSRREIRVLPNPQLSASSMRIGPQRWYLASPQSCGDRMLVHNAVTERLELRSPSGKRMRTLTKFEGGHLKATACRGNFVTFDVNGFAEIRTISAR